MPEFFSTTKSSFDLLASGGWRTPQLGALGAILRHWSLARREPTLISIPTGTGKTAVALAAPFLASTPPGRVLILAPSRQLREQLAEQFRSFDTIVRLGAIPRPQTAPKVHEMTGRCDDWTELEEFDVVVALPNSISPVHYEDPSKPPANLFQMLIVDEAHHSPSRTWSAILDHFTDAQSVLLTATPQRRDGRRIPGSLEYYYPLRRALDEGLYQPISPLLLPAVADGEARDRAIAAAAAELLASPEYATSSLLIRAGSVDRLRALKTLYADCGVDVSLLYNRLGTGTQSDIVAQLRAGEVRAVAVVGMLGEGFDLPSIRLLSYHDKHRSVPATMQLIGRLARVDPAHPQASRLITVADADTYPELKGVLRALYEEDSDWAEVLPGILDAEIAVEQADRQFVQSLPESTTEVDPTHLAPLKRAVVYELPADWDPQFLHQIPNELTLGERLLGGEVIFAGAIEDANMLVAVIRYVDQPRWSTDPALADLRYELHVATYRRPPLRTLPGFLFLNLSRPGAKSTFESLLGLEGVATLTGPERLGAYLDSLNRISVSSVGIRNTNAATRGRASYRNYMGSGVDRGLRSVDLTRSALGHVMFQIQTDSGSANAGAAVEKSKIWLSRYGPLRSLSDWADVTAGLLWYPQQAAQGPLLPGVERGQRLESWPSTRPLAAEISPLLLGMGYELWDGPDRLGAVEDLDLYVNTDPTGTLTEVETADPAELQIVGVLVDREADSEACVWQATINASGHITASNDLEVHHGYATPQPLSAILEQHPPTVYFLDGTTTIGSIRYDSRTPTAAFDLHRLKTTLWENVDLTAETRRTVEERGAGKKSVHERLEEYLLAKPRVGTRRWILCNDGAGEIADYLVLEEMSTGEVALSLWHAKGAGGSPSVRIGDFQVVVAQALRSRSVLPSTTVWEQLGRRLEGEESPLAVLVDGSDDVEELRQRLGLADRDEDADGDNATWIRRLPVVIGTIAIAQPGLSAARMREDLATTPVAASASGLNQLFSVLLDAAISDGAELEILVSP